MTASKNVDRLMIIGGAEADSVTGRHLSLSSPAHDTPVATCPHTPADWAASSAGRP